jgi:hypothetical protein
MPWNPSSTANFEFRERDAHGGGDADESTI